MDGGPTASLQPNIFIYSTTKVVQRLILLEHLRTLHIPNFPLSRFTSQSLWPEDSNDVNCVTKLARGVVRSRPRATSNSRYRCRWKSPEQRSLRKNAQRRVTKHWIVISSFEYTMSNTGTISKEITSVWLPSLLFKTITTTSLSFRRIGWSDLHRGFPNFIVPLYCRELLWSWSSANFHLTTPFSSVFCFLIKRGPISGFYKVTRKPIFLK